jgi:hypothetical protein
MLREFFTGFNRFREAMSGKWPTQARAALLAGLMTGAGQ